jgi:hypothetical protein
VSRVDAASRYYRGASCFTRLRLRPQSRTMDLDEAYEKLKVMSEAAARLRERHA